MTQRRCWARSIAMQVTAISTPRFPEWRWPHQRLLGGDGGGIRGRLSQHRRGRGGGNGAAGAHERDRSFGLDVTAMAGALQREMTHKTSTRHRRRWRLSWVGGPCSVQLSADSRPRAPQSVRSRPVHRGPRRDRLDHLPDRERRWWRARSGPVTAHDAYWRHSCTPVPIRVGTCACVFVSH